MCGRPGRALTFAAALRVAGGRPAVVVCQVLCAVEWNLWICSQVLRGLHPPSTRLLLHAQGKVWGRPVGSSDLGRRRPGGPRLGLVLPCAVRHGCVRHMVPPAASWRCMRRPVGEWRSSRGRPRILSGLTAGVGLVLRKLVLVLVFASWVVPPPQHCVGRSLIVPGVRGRDIRRCGRGCLPFPFGALDLAPASGVQPAAWRPGGLVAEALFLSLHGEFGLLGICAIFSQRRCSGNFLLLFPLASLPSPRRGCPVLVESFPGLPSASGLPGWYGCPPLPKFSWFLHFSFFAS